MSAVASRIDTNTALIPLRAGPLTMRCDPESGSLRWIALGGREVLRGIYGAVRDQNWGTVPAALHEVQRKVNADSFLLEFIAEHRRAEIDFRWRGLVRGDADGAVRFEFDGEARSEFLRNRIGLCVLHPIRECAGASARQTRVGGEVIECRFPDVIEPQIVGSASFRELSTVAHEVEPKLWAEVGFEGEIFEMEDQRNWTDASFKTYGTPLALPFPVEVRVGDSIRQRVTLRLCPEDRRGEATKQLREVVATPLRGVPARERQQEPAFDVHRRTAHKAVATTPCAISSLGSKTQRENENAETFHVRAPLQEARNPVENRLSAPASHVEVFETRAAAAMALHWPTAPTGSLPQIGVSRASHEQPLSPAEIERLCALKLAHLRADVWLASSHWVRDWREACDEAGALGVALELAIHLPPERATEFDKVAALTERSGVRFSRVLGLREGEAATTPATLARMRKLFPHARVGAGSDAHFCELNREQALGRVPLADADFLFWPITPQVHASDSLSMIETLEAQPETARSARAFAPGRPLVISPVTLKPRFNAVATGAKALPPGELPPPVDPRQMSSFAAAWTVGCIMALAAARVESVTFFETIGWRGLMETASGSPLPEKFPSAPGQLFPMYDVFAALAGFSKMTPVELPRSSNIAALALFDRNRARLLLANLLAIPQRVQVSRQGSKWDVELAPYALAILDEPL